MRENSPRCQDCQQAGWEVTTTEHTGAALLWTKVGMSIGATLRQLSAHHSASVPKLEGASYFLVSIICCL